MIKRGLQIVGFMWLSAAMGQENLSFFKNNDTLPRGITETSTSKARKEIKRENTHQRRSIRRATREFFYDSNFGLDNFLYNGRVVFNKEFTTYVNQVADVLLKNEPLVRSKLRFYLISSADVNAYTDHSGAVFITTGMMARLNTEAQLAAVLGHEAVHFVLRHSLVGHIEEFKIDQGISNYASNLGNEVLRKHMFGRVQETESDLYGFKTFYKTGYRIGAPLEVFNLLKTADQPCFDGWFNEDLCKVAGSSVPSSWFSKEYIDPLKLPEESDKYSTHPALSKRLDTLRQVIKSLKLDTLQGTDFLVSKETFNEIKRQSELSLCNLYILDEDYRSAFYHINYMLRKYPGNLYLEGEYARLLYVFACEGPKRSGNVTVIYVNDPNHGVITEKGLNKQVREFLEPFRPAEVALMALLSANRYAGLSGNHESKIYLDECVRILLKEREFDLNKVGIKLMDGKVEADSLLPLDTNLVRKQFIEHFKKPLLEAFAVPAVTAAYQKYKSPDNQIVKSLADDDDSKELSNSKKLLDSTFVNCGNSLIVLDPVFYSVDLRQDEEEKVEQTLSEKKEHQLLGRLQRSARSFRTKTVHVYDWKTMKQEDITKYDQLASLNEWYSDYHHSKEQRRLSINEWKKEKIMNETGSRYVAEFIFIGVKIRKQALPFIVQFYRPLVLPFWFPDAIVQMAKPKEHTYMLVKIFDLEKNTCVYTEVKTMVNVRPQPSIIGGLVHNTVLKAFNGKLGKK